MPHLQLPRLVCSTGTYAMLENMRDNLDDSIAIASGWAELAAAACTDVAEGATTYVPHGGHGGHSSTHRVHHLFGQPLFVICVAERLQFPVARSVRSLPLQHLPRAPQLGVEGGTSPRSRVHGHFKRRLCMC